MQSSTSFQSPFRGDNCSGVPVIAVLLCFPGIEIMSIYKYGSVVSHVFPSLLMSLEAHFRCIHTVVYMFRGLQCMVVSPQAMSFEAHSLTVPSVMWLGLLPSDLQRFGLNLPYFLHPPASNWNGCIFQGIVCFGFCCCCPAFLFFLRRCSSASEAILTFKCTLLP